jgi:hypothetical protein
MTEKSTPESAAGDESFVKEHGDKVGLKTS